MINDWLGLVIVFILVLINGFFVAAEFSLVSVRKTRIDELVAHGQRDAKAVQHAIKDPDPVSYTHLDVYKRQLPTRTR